jgi:hypothetical protein
MSTWFAEFTFELAPDLDESLFDAHFEDVLEALDEMDGVTDADGTVAWADRQLHIHTAVQGEDQLDVMIKTAAALRTAIHAAGGSTPGWDQLAANVARNAAQLAVHPEPV